MKKKIAGSSIVMVIIAVLLALLLLFNCQQAPLPGEDPETGDEDADDEADEEEEDDSTDEGVDCWWLNIDYLDATAVGIVPSSRTEWKNILVAGDFRWRWESLVPNDYEIVKEMSVIDHYSLTSSGQHTFAVSTSTEYGLAVTNPTSVFNPTELWLDQWVCEGESLNWDPHMFDEPYEEGGEQGDCEQFCLDNGFPGGSEPSIFGCSGSEVLIGGCCCNPLPT